MADKHFVRIVVASPSDTINERNAVQRVVNRLNRELGNALGIHIEVSRWETDTFPGFHLEGSQGFVESILRIEECDILICIFGRRFGTQTRRVRSGTESEFRRAYDAWKETGKPQIMMYFLEGPFSPSNSDEQDQWDALQKFRSKFPSEGLYWEYKNSREFARLLKQHLASYFAQSPIRVLYRAPLASLSSQSTKNLSKKYYKSRAEYHIRANTALRRPGSDLKIPLADFDCEVVARKVSGSNGSWYGVNITQGRGSGGDVSYHDFFVSGKGTYTYEVKTMDEDENSMKDLNIIQSSQLAMSIAPGNSANRLRLIRRGSIVEFHVNGSRLLQITASLDRIEEVQVGIAIHAARNLPTNQHIEVAFSNWVFYKPE